MRILQVYDLAPDTTLPTDGVGLAIRGLSGALVALGHEVWILAGAGLSAEPLRTLDGAKFVRIEARNLMRRSWSATTLHWSRQLLFPVVASCNMRALRQFAGFDIFHGHIYSGGLVALALGKSLGGKVVNTIHGSYYDIWPSLLPKRTARLVRHAEKRAALFLAKHADVQIHTGGYFRETLERWGADPNKLTTLHNGVDRSLFDRAMPPRLTPRPVFFTARRLVKKNGLHILLAAFEEVAKELNAELRIAGEGPELRSLQEQCVNLGIHEQVTFTGALDRDKLPRFVQDGQVAVIPSLAEASSLFLLECMALRRPVVCSDVGGLTEVVDKHTAWIARAGDSEDLARKMSAAVTDWNASVEKADLARSLAESQFTWDSVAERTLGIYER